MFLCRVYLSGAGTIGNGRRVLRGVCRYYRKSVLRQDIRRLVAHGSVFNNNEKVNIVRRVLLGLDAAGVDTVLTMPDAFNIAESPGQSQTGCYGARA